jgi:hypothetical protein
VTELKTTATYTCDVCGHTVVREFDGQPKHAAELPEGWHNHEYNDHCPQHLFRWNGRRFEAVGSESIVSGAWGTADGSLQATLANDRRASL